MESGELPKEGQGGGVDSPSSFSDPLSPPMMLIGSVSPVDTILILFISICTALLSEALTYVLVYRTRHYKKLKAEVEKQSKKVERHKEGDMALGGAAASPVSALGGMGRNKKKLEREEEKLKMQNRELSSVKMKSMFAIGFTFTALMGMFNTIFEGRVVAKLPFTPLSWIQGLSHRSLLGNDPTDCSFIFLYILCTMSVRQNIQKALGLAPSRAVSKLAGGGPGGFFSQGQGFGK